MANDEKTSKDGPILISFNPEIEQLLGDNKLDIVEEIRKQSADFRVAGINDLPLSVRTEFKETKEPLTILFGSAALALALTPIIQKIIDAISNRPIVIEEAIWVPVESASGEIVRHANGDPVLQRTVRSKILERKQSPSSDKVTLQGPMEIKVGYETTSG